MYNKIFCIGLSRSGTTSLHNTLVQLGLNSKHFHFELYTENNFNAIEDADAFSDSPIPKIYKKLDRKFPNSKFILTIRNKEHWLDSMKWMFEEGKVLWWWGYHIHKYHREFYGSKTFDKNLMSMKYDQYHTDVLAYFKDRPDDLLILHVDKGTDTTQVCSFLGLDEATFSFPKSNPRKVAPYKRKVMYRVFSFFLFSYQSEWLMRRAMKLYHIAIS